MPTEKQVSDIGTGIEEFEITKTQYDLVPFQIIDNEGNSVINNFDSNVTSWVYQELLRSETGTLTELILGTFRKILSDATTATEILNILTQLSVSDKNLPNKSIF